MNPERLSKMQSQVRIGGKGTQRRKKKVVHKTNTDDKKLQNSLKKLAVNTIPGIEDVHIFKDDGHVIHFNNPKVQASLPANTFAITGHAETKPVTDLVPRILNTDSLRSAVSGAADDGDDDVPDLVGDFDAAAAKNAEPEKEAATAAAATTPAAPAGGDPAAPSKETAAPAAESAAATEAAPKVEEK